MVEGKQYKNKHGVTRTWTGDFTDFHSAPCLYEEPGFQTYLVEAIKRAEERYGKCIGYYCGLEDDGSTYMVKFSAPDKPEKVNLKTREHRNDQYCQWFLGDLLFKDDIDE